MPDEQPPITIQKSGLTTVHQTEGNVKMFNINIDVLESGEINVTNGGTLDSDTFAILSDVFELKKKHEKRSEAKTDDDYDPTTGEEPGRMN